MSFQPLIAALIFRSGTILLLLCHVAVPRMKASDRAQRQATILETRVISQAPDSYHGWPTVARRANGELWVVCSGGREAHVCPFGQVQAMTSRDEGRTWTWPRVVLDSAGDDRDAGVIETKTGALLITTFTSTAYVAYLQRGEAIPREGQKGTMAPARLARWQAVHDRLTDAEREADKGEWLPAHLLKLRSGALLATYGHRRPPLGNQARISTDHGRIWSEAIVISGDGSSADLGYPSTVELSDGTLLTIWYETMQASAKAVLRQARWRFVQP